ENMLVRLPGNGPAAYAMQHFFAWVAPRVPHAPLTAPAAIQNFLFDGLTPPALGGILDLGQYCNGASCPPMVDAFEESNFGNQYEYYANLFWSTTPCARCASTSCAPAHRTASAPTGWVATRSRTLRSVPAPGRRACRPISRGTA